MNTLRRELQVFLRCSRSMRILLFSNMIYALALPVIEIFIAAYVMRNSHEVSKVVTFQLSLYIATPMAFLVNGILLGRVAVKRLYAAGMLFSGVAMIGLMRSGALTMMGIALSGLAMGLATGLFWANRGFLALASTDDGNRNYYYGIETFCGTLAAVVVPALVGWFIAGTVRFGWLRGVANNAYRVVAVSVFGLTLVSAGILQFGTFRNPAHPRFIFFKFQPVWYRMLELSLLKGLAQGYLITAPAMLIMLLVGKEGTLGATQSIGGVASACVLYGIGRAAAPRHRVAVLSLGVLVFFAGAAASAVLFNEAGVLIFVLCLVLSKPMLDLGYNPIELHVVDAVSRMENRSEYGYLFNHEFGLFVGRFLGCVLFLAIASWGSGIAALRYAMPVIALLQLISIPVAKRILRELKGMPLTGARSAAAGTVVSRV